MVLRSSIVLALAAWLAGCSIFGGIDAEDYSLADVGSGGSTTAGPGQGATTSGNGSGGEGSSESTGQGGSSACTATDTKTETRTIDSDADDAEFSSSSWGVQGECLQGCMGTGTLRITDEDNEVGLRFQGFSIPPGAMVVEATLGLDILVRDPDADELDVDGYLPPVDPFDGAHSHQSLDAHASSDELPDGSSSLPVPPSTGLASFNVTPAVAAIVGHPDYQGAVALTLLVDLSGTPPAFASIGIADSSHSSGTAPTLRVVWTCP